MFFSFTKRYSDIFRCCIHISWALDFSLSDHQAITASSLMKHASQWQKKSFLPNQEDLRPGIFFCLMFLWVIITVFFIFFKEASSLPLGCLLTEAKKRSKRKKQTSKLPLASLKILDEKGTAVKVLVKISVLLMTDLRRKTILETIVTDTKLASHCQITKA